METKHNTQMNSRMMGAITMSNLGRGHPDRVVPTRVDTCDQHCMKLRDEYLCVGE